MKKTLWSAAALMCAAVAANAQTIDSLKVSPSGQSVTATVAFKDAESPNCGLRFYWGDGQTQDIKLVDTKQLPLVLQHSYAKPGTYDLMAEGKKVTSHLKCGGANARAKVTLAASAPMPAAAGAPVAPAAMPAKPAVASASTAAAAKPVSHCPEGWKLDAKSVNKKTGAFTCTAKPGTPLPEKKMACGGDTGYFENAKKGQMGCRP